MWPFLHSFTQIHLFSECLPSICSMPHTALSAITLISEQSAVRIKIVNVCVCVCVCVLGGYFELVIWEDILKDNISDKNWVLIVSPAKREGKRIHAERIASAKATVTYLTCSKNWKMPRRRLQSLRFSEKVSGNGCVELHRLSVDFILSAMGSYKSTLSREVMWPDLL